MSNLTRIYPGAVDELGLEVPFADGREAERPIYAGFSFAELGELGAGHASDLDVGRLPRAVTAVCGLLSTLRIHRLVARP